MSNNKDKKTKNKFKCEDKIKNNNKFVGYVYVLKLNYIK